MEGGSWICRHFAHHVNAGREMDDAIGSERSRPPGFYGREVRAGLDALVDTRLEVPAAPDEAGDGVPRVE
jgi:hypothetical protein